MKIKRNLIVAVVMTAMVAVAGTAAAETELVVVLPGGAHSASQQSAYHDPYMRGESRASKSLTTIQRPKQLQNCAMNEVGKVTWDFWWTPSLADAMRLCDEASPYRLMQTRTWPRLLTAPGFKGFGDLLSYLECFIPQIVYSTTFGYRTDKVKSKPTSVCDVFDLKKIPGKFLEKKPINNFEWALLCDGVAPDKIYDVMVPRAA